MGIWSSTLVAATTIAVGQTVFALIPPALERQADPCTVIAGKPYVVPSDVNSCLKYAPFPSDQNAQ